MIVYKLEYDDRAGYEVKKYHFVGDEGKIHWMSDLHKSLFGAIHTEIENIRIERRKLIDRYIQLQKMEAEIVEVPLQSTE